MSLYLGNNCISAGGSSAFRNTNIGEIIQSTIPLTDAGLHLLDGSLISGSGSYSDFVTYIAGLVSNYPDLFTTEANWQSAVTTYGVCGKFVYTSGSPATVRLPKVTGFVEGTTDVTALGDLIQAGLPNITGRMYSTSWPGRSDAEQATGAFTISGHGGTWAAQGSYGYDILFDFNASRSSSIYGNSNTVQPQAIKVLYYIVIANSTKTQIEVDIDEIATDLNGKADVDLSNCTKPHIVETYVNGTSWYRVYSDGWCEQGGACTLGTFSYSFIKEYISRPDVQLTRMSIYNNAVYGKDMAFNAIPTTTGFTLNSNFTSTYFLGADWRACGYIS